MTDNAHLLSDIVQAARDGAEFYDAAAGEVSSPQLRDTFVRMAEAKRTLIAALSGRLQMMGAEPPQTGTVRGALRKAYADLRAVLARRDEQVYVAQLEEAEDRLLAQFEDAVAKTDNPEIRSQLQAHLPNVRACHDELRRLKQRPAA
ncbi:MAG TPA: PA2169 family four-helix-bundle protein [Xanthomonadales bacterium]|nr:PA2169 family four-helix-bundle protein [Xanthomonadales bacterium]